MCFKIIVYQFALVLHVVKEHYEEAYVHPKLALSHVLKSFQEVIFLSGLVLIAIFFRFFLQIGENHLSKDFFIVGSNIYTEVINYVLHVWLKL